ncbi:plant basic secretory protein [Schizopora paradoxa]|uniref:Plant basic secretory protein n=1 Tax=Schizopora paradoxa TaxID=27342 RepID=A0A0H2RI78_9AGAM|nr:plant basic secretory protein [Schizopora paradoxa]
MSSIQEHFKSDKNGHSNDAEQSHRDSGYSPSYGEHAVPQKPLPEKDWPMPKLRIQVADLSSPGSIEFFANLHPTELLREAVMAVLTTLYTPENCPRHVRSVTLYIDEMGGVAHSNGSSLDDDHKEIHLSTSHISNNKQRAKDEIRGVIFHEMVHCYQYNGKGKCPGGLIEGIADFVRLRAQLGPPHWKRGGSKWDEGYQTTAFFLDWLDGKFGAGTVQKINLCMRQPYRVEIFQEVTGQSVESLWQSYKESLGN